MITTTTLRNSVKKIILSQNWLKNYFSRGDFCWVGRDWGNKQYFIFCPVSPPAHLPMAGNLGRTGLANFSSFCNGLHVHNTIIEICNQGCMKFLASFLPWYKTLTKTGIIRKVLIDTLIMKTGKYTIICYCMSIDSIIIILKEKIKWTPLTTSSCTGSSSSSVMLGILLRFVSCLMSSIVTAEWIGLNLILKFYCGFYIFCFCTIVGKLVSETKETAL